MKVWTKVRINQKDRELEKMMIAYTNYIFKDTSLSLLARKYKMYPDDIKVIYQETAARFMGLLLLYLGNDKRRLKDILNRYSGENIYLKDVLPIVEGYVDRES